MSSSKHGNALVWIRKAEKKQRRTARSVNSKNQSVPSVSIIVPVKNGEATIQHLLESLMEIDYEEEKLEVIVVDGNSTDNTREIVSKFPVKLIEEERAGLNAARNTGIKYSKGEIIAFTDCDCVVPNHWIRRIAENFRNLQVGCVGGSILGYHDNFLSTYCDRSVMPVMRIFKDREVLDTVMPPLRYPAGCNMATRREILEKVGPFNEKVRYGFDEDELVERICEEGYKMVLDPKVFVQHKHRQTLTEVLKQTFQYGMGGGLLLKMKGMNSAFSKWILLFLLGFIVWISSVVSLTLFSIPAGFMVSLVALLTIILLPPIGLMIFYVHQTLSREDKEYERILTYPFIDMMRSATFLAGVVYQLLKQ